MSVFGNSTEHPRRVEAFFSRIRGLSWDGADRLASLDALHEALNDLAQYEIEYYYFARKRKRHASAVMRGGTLILGTAGLLAPLIAAADHERYAFLSPWGYVWLGGAAAILTVNKIFGATGGHIRLVRAQYDLEGLVTAFRIEWQRWRARHAHLPPDQWPVDEAFDTFRRFADAMYKLIDDETESWARGVTAALEEYARSLSARTGDRPRKP